MEHQILICDQTIHECEQSGNNRGSEGVREGGSEGEVSNINHLVMITMY